MRKVRKAGPAPAAVGALLRMADALPSNVSWTQDDDSVEVTVRVPDAAARADVRVKTQADSLTVALRDGAGAWSTTVTGLLRHDVERESCCWALEKRRGGDKALVIQLEKRDASRSWDALFRASGAGSILEELGRDQVIVDAGASTAESIVCGRCGALVKASRMEAHATLWCDALASDEAPKGPADHLYWARTPTNPVGSVAPRRLEADAAMDALCWRVEQATTDVEADLAAAEAAQAAAQARAGGAGGGGGADDTATKLCAGAVVQFLQRRPYEGHVYERGEYATVKMVRDNCIELEEGGKIDRRTCGNVWRCVNNPEEELAAGKVR